LNFKKLKVIKVSFTVRHADGLFQLDNGKKIPPRGWKCEAEGCTKTDNLWLNLTDGAILCGRKNFDGSGGNNHAVEHFARASNLNQNCIHKDIVFTLFILIFI